MLVGGIGVGVEVGGLVGMSVGFDVYVGLIVGIELWLEEDEEKVLDRKLLLEPGVGVMVCDTELLLEEEMTMDEETRPVGVGVGV